MKSGRTSPVSVILLSMVLVSSFILLALPPVARAATPATLGITALDEITSSIVDPNLTPGKTLTVDVTIANAPNIVGNNGGVQGFDITVNFDYHILRPVGIGYQTGQNPTCPSTDNCLLDGKSSIAYALCPPASGCATGSTRAAISMSTLADRFDTSVIPTGVMFRILFNVVGIGVTNIAVAPSSPTSQLVGPVSGLIVQIPYTTVDGSFDNTPPFSFSLSPASGAIFPGKWVSTNITVTGGTVGPVPVDLSISGLPTGASEKLNVTTGTTDYPANLNITTATTTPRGIYMVRITGSCTVCGVNGVGFTASTNFALTVAVDYTVAWSPSSATVAAGTGTTPSVVATLTSGLAVPVTCTVSLPSPAVNGLSASPLSFSITPAVAPGATKVVTVSTTIFTPGGPYTIGVSCTGGIGGQTASFSLTVTAAPFDYTVAWSPTSNTIVAGSTTRPKLIATLTSGQTVSVTCTVSLPSPAVTGLSASPLSFSISPVVASGTSQIVTISTTVFTPGGTYTVGVSCTGGVGTHTATFSLTVTAAVFNYSVAWSPTSATIVAGAGSTPSLVATLTSGTAAAPVTCTVSLPSPTVTGLSASPLSPSITPTVAGATQAVTISTTVSTPSGTYTIGVSCTGGVGTHTANFSLMVTAAFDYTVAWSPTSATVTAGSSTTPNVVAALTSGTATSITCTVSVPAVTGLSAGTLSFGITPAVAPGATQAVTISSTLLTPGGTYTIGVSCTGGVGTHTADFSLKVTVPPSSGPSLAATLTSPIGLAGIGAALLLVVVGSVLALRRRGSKNRS